MKALLVLCVAMPALCQPAFTVASMRVTEFLPEKKPKITFNPGRLSLTGFTLQELIARAYGVEEFRVRGADAVLHERYTISATMPVETAEQVVWQMLQSLLAERLQLKLRRSPEEMPVYAIVLGRNGAKVKRSAGGEPSVKIRGGAIEGKNATMGNLAGALSGLFDRPVIDQTGLTGAYDFALGFTPDAMLGTGMAKLSAQMEPADAGGPSIFGALQQQLGLRLEPRKAPVETLVVDRAIKAPLEN